MKHMLRQYLGKISFFNCLVITFAKINIFLAISSSPSPETEAKMSSMVRQTAIKS